MEIGSIVECIKSSKGGPLSENQMALLEIGYKSPVKGGVYTVRGFTLNKRGIFLEEIVNRPVMTIKGFLEVGWSIAAFVELLPPDELAIESIMEVLNIEPVMI